MRAAFRYTFARRAPTAEVEATLRLAVIAVEALHGEGRARLEARHSYNARRRVAVIDAAAAVGRDLNRLFLGFASREFGSDSFEVERITPSSPARPAVA